MTGDLAEIFGWVIHWRFVFSILYWLSSWLTDRFYFYLQYSICPFTILQHFVMMSWVKYVSLQMLYTLETLDSDFVLVIQCVILWMQETLLTWLLRNYLYYNNLYDHEEKLRSKETRFEVHYWNQQVYLLVFHTDWLL